MQQIRAYTDIVVKYLLGREETTDILLSFLNAVMEDSGLDLIESVELKNPFNLQEFTGDKLSVLDVKAVTTAGHIIDIEIQGNGDRTYVHRSLYYWAKLYTGQITEAEPYKKLNPVSCINVLNFRLLEEIPKFHSLYVLKEKDDTSKVLTDHLMLHFIELPKVTPEMCRSHLEKWSQYFIYEGEDNAVMETLLKDEPVFQKAHHEFKRFTEDERLRDIYESRLKAQRDYVTLIENAREQGLEQGIEQGTIDTKRETAISMLKDSIAVEKISLYTGLSVEEIRTLDVN